MKDMTNDLNNSSVGLNTQTAAWIYNYKHFQQPSEVAAAPNIPPPRFAVPVAPPAPPQTIWRPHVFLNKNSKMGKELPTYKHG